MLIAICVPTFAKKNDALVSPLYAKRVEQSKMQFKNMGNIENRSYEESGYVINTPASVGLSVCLGSACIGSVCLGSGCLYSLCIGSGCMVSGCTGSVCVSSGCSSVCVGSVCVGSVCMGSSCVGSVCNNCN